WLNSSLISMLTRHIGSQFKFNISYYGQYARTSKLFIKLPAKMKLSKNAKNFDFQQAFRNLNKISLENFLHIGVVLLSAAISNVGITDGYFTKAKSQGLNLPPKNSIKSALELFVADQSQMADLYGKFKQSDRNYAAYDFNPLFVYPFIRPWLKP